MLESLAANLLNRYIGAYIENIDPEKLSIAAWKGEVSLTKVKLSKSALDKLDLPVEVTFGYLENLLLKIPWTNLGSSPVQLKIDSLFLVAKPKVEQEYDEDKEVEQEFRKKQKLLADFEQKKENLRKEKEAQPTDNDRDQPGGISLISKIINNIQVQICNVHIRYEDCSSLSEECVSAGITLENLSLRTTDSNWQEKFIDSIPAITYKLLTLDNFSLYMNNKALSVSTADADGFAESMKCMIASEKTSQH
ncbi:uncharacterized protein LOC135121330 [Zophobas morio]|uniref:uncharacterized protein LOC135121330 n=1 Tax=Zophobas morio TaxID=2755281 RepID=UPI0030835112